MSQNPQIEALKPCPFCGREPELYTVSNGDGAELEFVFRCEECGVEKSAEWKHEAVAVWNRRASQEAAAPSEELGDAPENTIDNPKSWAAWKREADSWRRVAERLETEKQAAPSEEPVATCPGADDPEERCPKQPHECTCWEVDLDYHPRHVRAAIASPAVAPVAWRVLAEPDLPVHFVRTEADAKHLVNNLLTYRKGCTSARIDPLYSFETVATKS